MATATDRSKPENVPALLFGGLAVVFGVFSVWMGREAVLLRRGRKPITWYTRNYASWHPGWASLVIALIGFAVGSGVTHFVWDESDHP